MQEDVYTSYLIKDSPLFRWVLNTHIPRDYIAMKMTLDYYEWLTNLSEHVQKIWSSL
jgi:hypothetical protein